MSNDTPFDPNSEDMPDLYTVLQLSRAYFEEGKDWDAYFRQLWAGVVDAQTIAQFAKVYKGSEEERSDLLAAYRLHEGDIGLILTEVMLAEAAIGAKEVKRTRAYTKSKKLATKRKADAEDEAVEAEALRKELGLDDQLRKAKANSKAKGGSKRNRGGASDDDEVTKAQSRRSLGSARTAA
ncbi:hypothetical protein BX661DRAFT_204826 [Kickxella alabastrina]|uniref:uncharacterized protein n=1 Tax=Kickxella alabastrina TaxID=61397 RepID=UPI0022201F8B|nr:uncharacterized protein BX661DRAFT_204826 [Kickxella alabastrina]KAI7830106.1 hypothetical protein BX661DRAFT_204826 [Kickxella alabastrina]